MIRSALVLLAFFVPAAAWAGDLDELRRALARDDRAAVERWVAAEAAAGPGDPLASLGTRPQPEALQEQATALARQEALLTAAAIAYLALGDQAKPRLLAGIDAVAAGRQQLARGTAQAAATPAKPLMLTRLATTGEARGGKRAEAATEFPPDEKTINVGYAYRDGAPGEELSARWIHLVPGAPVELTRSSARLQKPVDQGRFSFSPGRPWTDGLYRVEISARGAVVGETDFLVRGPQAAAVPLPFPGRQAAVATKPGAPSPAPAASSPAPGGPVSVLEALFAKDVENGEAKDPVTEFSTARKRLVLWARVQAAGGGALTARWFATDGGERLLGEHTLAVPAGESRVAYWLEAAHDKAKFTRDLLRVDLVSGGRVVKSLPLRLRQAGFFDEVGAALEQFGRELEKAIQGEGK